MKVMLRQSVFSLLAMCAICFALATSLNAQVETQTSTSVGQATHEIKVESGEVVLVEGNDLIVKMDDGTIRHFANVPETTKITVNGQQMGIHDLKPGMKLQRTITTTTTPKTITTTQSVTGKIWKVNPPSSVILTMDDNKNQMFAIPKGQMFNVNGQMVDAFHLKKGMEITATKVVEVPEMVVTQKRKIAGTMPPPTPPPPDMPILVVFMSRPAPSAAPDAAPAALPKTGSMLPLVGVLGLLSCGLAMGIRKLRA
jgi:hypothetical protein